MKQLRRGGAFLILGILATTTLATSCSDRNQPVPTGKTPSAKTTADVAEVSINPLGDAYFGNFHVHTSYSFDGYTNGSVTNPDDAFRWATGEAIPGGGGGGDLQINVPLDWYAVSEHSEYLGVFKMMEDPNGPFGRLEIAERITSDD